MKKTIFNYSDYRQVIVDFIESMPQKGRGQRSALAEFVGCQSAYLSRVLGGQAEFNFEQAEAVTRFFHMPLIEKKFFLLLFQLNRSTSKESQKFLKI